MVGLLSIDWHRDANILILIAAAMAAISAIYRFAVMPLYRGIRGGVLLIVSAMESVKWVEEQMKPNGGSSLRDAVDKLVRRTEALEDRIDGLDLP